VTLEELRRIANALQGEKVDYVVIGPAALNAHGILRATEDVDMMVRPTEENVARLRRALRSVWDDAAIDGISAADLAGEYPAIRYGPPQGSLYIDIVARFGEAFAFDDVDSEVVDLNGAVVRVATPAALYRMKRGTVRPIDRADADALRRRFDIEE
jgi:hypothetical protein